MALHAESSSYLIGPSLKSHRKKRDESYRKLITLPSYRYRILNIGQCEDFLILSYNVPLYENSFLSQSVQKITVTDDTAMSVYWIPLLLFLLWEAEYSNRRPEVRNILK
jgi:hypothetical protein